jgi:hypothetical protein
VFTCICRAVTDDKIRAAIVLGASTVDAVAGNPRQHGPRRLPGKSRT